MTRLQSKRLCLPLTLHVTKSPAMPNAKARSVDFLTCRTPKGTAFLEFATVEAANAAVDASKGGHEGHEDGIQVRGQLLVLSIAVDREAARRSSKSDASSNIAHADDSKSIERTVFIRNLPSDVNVEEMREKFSVFGDVKSARLVLHPVTKYAKTPLMVLALWLLRMKELCLISTGLTDDVSGGPKGPHFWSLGLWKLQKLLKQLRKASAKTG